MDVYPLPDDVFEDELEADFDFDNEWSDTPRASYNWYCRCQSPAYFRRQKLAEQYGSTFKWHLVEWVDDPPTRQRLPGF